MFPIPTSNCVFKTDGRRKCRNQTEHFADEPMKVMISISKTENDQTRNVSNSILSVPYKINDKKADSIFKDICKRDWGTIQIEEYQSGKGTTTGSAPAAPPAAPSTASGSTTVVHKMFFTYSLAVPGEMTIDLDSDKNGEDFYLRLDPRNILGRETRFQFMNSAGDAPLAGQLGSIFKVTGKKEEYDAASKRRLGIVSLFPSDIALPTPGISTRVHFLGK